jgi:hypothetical protein
MARRNYTAEMKRTALNAAADFFSKHQAAMDPHELVAATHLLHVLALAVERASTWEEKRRLKLGGQAVQEQLEQPVDESHGENPGPIPVSLGLLADVLRSSPVSQPPDHVAPVRRSTQVQVSPPRRVVPPPGTQQQLGTRVQSGHGTVVPQQQPISRATRKPQLAGSPSAPPSLRPQAPAS